MRLLLFFSVLLLGSCFETNRSSKVSLCENFKNLRTCPEKAQTLILPRTFPASSIYIGFIPDSYHLDFLKKLIDIVKEHPHGPKLNVLIPRLDDTDAYDNLKSYFEKTNYEFLNFIPTSSDQTIWAQDYMEIVFDTQKGVSKILNLPYYGREGDYIPTSIGLSCQKQIIEQAEFDETNYPGNGDYGGNIDAITTKVMIVGNTISNLTYEILKSSISQKILEIDVHWLETGHVDELVTTLPLKENSNDCEQALFVASPDLALDIINSKTSDIQSFKSPYHDYFDDENTWPNFDHCLLSMNSKKKDCIELAKANRVYQKNIDNSIERLQAMIQKEHSCKLKIQKIPQLFIPLKQQAQYGTEDDRAIPLNPNAVNNIFFSPYLVLPQQEFSPFQNYIEAIAKKYPYKVIYSDSRFAHELNGGIHCATNISYGCSIK